MAQYRFVSLIQALFFPTLNYLPALTTWASIEGNVGPRSQVSIPSRVQRSTRQKGAHATCDFYSNTPRATRPGLSAQSRRFINPSTPTTSDAGVNSRSDEADVDPHAERTVQGKLHARTTRTTLRTTPVPCPPRSIQSTTGFHGRRGFRGSAPNRPLCPANTLERANDGIHPTPRHAGNCRLSSRCA